MLLKNNKCLGLCVLLLALHGHAQKSMKEIEQDAKDKLEEANKHDPHCPKTRASLDEAVEVLKKNKCSHMGVGGLWPDMAAILAEALETNTAMLKLDLNQYNEIGDKGAEAFAKALRTNKHLEHLFLANNGITEDGFTAFSEALDPFDGNNQGLKVLDLGANEGGVVGAKALAKALKHNKVLESLYLGSNSIGDRGAKAFAATIKLNSHLTTLFLRKNRITDKAVKSLMKAMEENKKITHLDFEPQKLSITGEGGELHASREEEDNVISTELANAIQNIVQRNRDMETERQRLAGESQSGRGAALPPAKQPEEDELSSAEL